MTQSHDSILKSTQSITNTQHPQDLKSTYIEQRTTYRVLHGGHIRSRQSTEAQYLHLDAHMRHLEINERSHERRGIITAQRRQHSMGPCCMVAQLVNTVPKYASRDATGDS